MAVASRDELRVLVVGAGFGTNAGLGLEAGVDETIHPIRTLSMQSSRNWMYEYVGFRVLGPCHGEVPLQHGKLLTDGFGDVVAVTAEVPRLLSGVKI